MTAGVPFAGHLSLQEVQARASANLPHNDFAETKSLALVITVVGVGIGLGLLSFCLPEELQFNLDKRTYRLAKGWPPLSLAQSGGWDDISGIYIKDIRSAYLVCLSYKHPVGRWTLIGISGRHSGAVTLARDLATRLSLPLINPPVGR